MANSSKKSILGAKNTSVDVTITKIEGQTFTIQVTRDDVTWEVSKYYSEFVFFRNTILEIATKFQNDFPKYTDDSKELLGDMNAWFKECEETIQELHEVNTLFFAFVKATESNIMKTGSNSEICAKANSVFRRENVHQGEALRTGYLLLHIPGAKEGNNLKKKYFALLDHFQYYESESAYLANDEPEGVIKLDAFFITKTAARSGHTQSQVHNISNCDFTILTYNPNVMSYTCRAANNAEMEAWHATLSSFSDMI